MSFRDFDKVPSACRGKFEFEKYRLYLVVVVLVVGCGADRNCRAYMLLPTYPNGTKKHIPAGMCTKAII